MTYRGHYLRHYLNCVDDNAKYGVTNVVFINIVCTKKAIQLNIRMFTQRFEFLCFIKRYIRKYIGLFGITIIFRYQEFSLTLRRV